MCVSAHRIDRYRIDRCINRKRKRVILCSLLFDITSTKKILNISPVQNIKLDSNEYKKNVRINKFKFKKTIFFHVFNINCVRMFWANVTNGTRFVYVHMCINIDKIHFAASPT